jgi:uncharacterized membrane protein YeaQ/YmgE (transglycosylase-associated protein family)
VDSGDSVVTLVTGLVSKVVKSSSVVGSVANVVGGAVGSLVTGDVSSSVGGGVVDASQKKKQL